MIRSNHFVAMIRVTSIAAIVALAMVTMAGSADAADNERSVLLTLRVEITGQTMVKIQPRDAKLWREDPDKPDRVVWWTVNSTQYPEILWEIRFDPDREGATVDYFGDQVISCDEAEVAARPTTMPDSAKANWPYVVEVYGCVDGQKSQKLGSIEGLIIWKD